MINTKRTCYLFLDYDGTVFLDGGIPAAYKDALRAAQRLGHKVILNTGRSRGGLNFSFPHNQGIDWDGKIFGSIDMVYGEVRYHEHTLTEDEVWHLVNRCLERPSWFAIEGENRTERFLTERKSKEPLSKQERNAVLASVKAILKDNPITKMTVQELDEVDLPSTGNIRFLKQPKHTELLPHGRDKGIAFLDFCKLYSIPKEQCVCFGDSLNDLAVFHVCPTSICMSTAPKELKECASYVAKTDFGVSEGLLWLFGDDLDLTNQ